MQSLLDKWLPSELAAWRPVERLSPAGWAERHRVLSRMQSARPGPWRGDNAPYLAGILDRCAAREVEELTIVKAAQVGVSEALRSVIGFYAHQEPDPILLVLPDEQTGRKIVAQRIVPLLRDTACLRQLFTRASRDVQLRHITLANGFTIRLGWSGSPASLASDPCRIVINDEVDKFQPFSGREADPISLGYARTQTYEGRRLIVNVSTPTTPDGLIWRRYEAADVHLRFHVPCPHCGEFQPLVFAQLRWKQAEDLQSQELAAQIEAERAAWYECGHCRQAISEAHKPAMLRQGDWIADGAASSDATAPQGRRVGMHIWAGYCLWVPWYRIAAEFLRCKDDPIALMGFTNAWLGEPFRQQIVHPKSVAFERKCAASLAAPARIVPAWAQVLIASADTQKDHFYYVIRAWGHGYRSQRIDHGLATGFEDLRARTLLPRYPFADSNRPPLLVYKLGIDSGGTASVTGSRTHEVYRFSLTDPSRIAAMKGASRAGDLPLVTRRVTYSPPDSRQAAFPIFLTLVDTNHYKDRLAHAIEASLPQSNSAGGTDGGEVEMWSLNDANDPDYNRQMASEHKVLQRTGNRQTQVWMPIGSGAANHYWDCEVMQFALADMLRLDLLPPPAIGAAAPAPQQPQRSQRAWPSDLRGRGPIRRNYGDM